MSVLSHVTIVFSLCRMSLSLVSHLNLTNAHGALLILGV